MRAMLFSMTLALAGTSPVWAAGEEGVWEGTVGTLPVRACLTRSEDGGWDMGSYYYMSKLIPLPLDAADSGTDLVERNEARRETARWTIARTSAGGLVGQWKSGQRRLPIALKPVAWQKTEEGPCGSDAFIGPRLGPLKVRSVPAIKDGLHYTKLIHTATGFPGYDMESFLIVETQPGDKAINAALKFDPSKENGPGDYISCARTALTQTGRDGYFSSGVQPAFVAGDFLSVAVGIGWTCGGAHPEDTQYHQTFDRRTGAKVDLGAWLTSAARSQPEDPEPRWIEATPALQRVILRHFPFSPQAPECREPVTEWTSWNLSIERGGIGFTQRLPHVIQACEDTAVVPFSELASFLSPAGKQGAARLTR